MTQSEYDEIVQFGKMMTRTFLVGLVVAAVLAFAFHEPVKGMVFYFMLLPLRQYAGGFHMKTRGGCAVVSTAIFIVNLYAIRSLCPSIYIQFMVFIIAAAVIILLMPVDNINNRLSEEEKEPLRRKAGFLILIYLAVFLGILCQARLDYAFIFVCCVVTEMVLLVIGRLHNELYDRNLR
ncbi:MAG: accessory gene regulator B family protein [Acetatifactor sp.]|nr:accessory gene regulator B family protein [Acetatifactor sp.]